MKIIKVQKVSDKLTNVVVEGEGHWCSVHRPKNKMGKNQGTEYSIDLIATQAEVDELNTKSGATLKLKRNKQGQLREDEKGRTYVGFKANGEFPDGEATPPIAVFDSNQRPLSDDVGNGSTVKVQLNIVPYNNEFGTGVSTRLVAVQVLNLVPYVKTGVNLELFGEVTPKVQEHLT